MVHMKTKQKSKGTKTAQNKRLISDIGKKGELVAETYFKSRGFEIVDKNYRKRSGEVDLICKMANILYFIEVKACVLPFSLDNTNQLGLSSPKSLAIRPEDKLNAAKIKKVAKMADLYKLSRGLGHLEHRLNALTVYLYCDGEQVKKVQVKYIPNIQVS